MHFENLEDLDSILLLTWGSSVATMQCLPSVRFAAVVQCLEKRYG